MQTFKAKRSDPIVKTILEVAFPDYKGRKIEVVFTDKVRISGTFWDEGSIRRYAAVNRNMDAVKIEWAHSIFDAPYEGQEVQLRDDFVIACHQIYIGKDMGVTIYAPMSLMPKMIEGAR